MADLKSTFDEAKSCLSVVAIAQDLAALSQLLPQKESHSKEQEEKEQEPNPESAIKEGAGSTAESSTPKIVLDVLGAMRSTLGQAVELLTKAEGRLNVASRILAINSSDAPGAVCEPPPKRQARAKPFVRTTFDDEDVDAVMGDDLFTDKDFDDALAPLLAATAKDTSGTASGDGPDALGVCVTPLAGGGQPEPNPPSQLEDAVTKARQS